MKLSNKEKQRILELHRNIPMKPWLFEQANVVPNTFSWGNNAPTATMGTDSGMYSTNVTRASEMEPEAYEQYLLNIRQNEKEFSERVHNFLGWTSFILGCIPIPQAQIASYGVDFANAALYWDEGDIYNAGLSATLASTSIISIPILNKALDGLTNIRNKKILKNLGDKLKLGNEGLRSLTKSEMLALDAIATNNNLKLIVDGFNEVAKKNAKSYLAKPKLFSKGYTISRFEHIGIKFREEYMDDMTKRGLNSLIDLGIVGVYNIFEYAVCSKYINPEVVQPLMIKASDILNKDNSTCNFPKTVCESYDGSDFDKNPEKESIDVITTKIGKCSKYYCTVKVVQYSINILIEYKHKKLLNLPVLVVDGKFGDKTEEYINKLLGKKETTLDEIADELDSIVKKLNNK